MVKKKKTKKMDKIVCVANKKKFIVRCAFSHYPDKFCTQALLRKRCKKKISTETEDWKKGKKVRLMIDIQKT